jgi:hypothetical protein
LVHPGIYGIFSLVEKVLGISGKGAGNSIPFPRKRKIEIMI